MKLVRDTKFCVTNWRALPKQQWPTVVACAKQEGPIKWDWPKRFTPLSIKCLINSAETYQLNGRAITVDPHSYLIINEGTEYSSSIDSDTDVDTASVFINAEVLSDVFASLSNTSDGLLDGDVTHKPVEFVERLYPSDERIRPLLLDIHHLTNSGADDVLIQDRILTLIENLFSVHAAVKSEIEQLQFVKATTRDEVYRRLHVCRDFILSDLSADYSLEEMAAVAGFAPHHFLRVFREVFRATPHQYLTHVRLERARRQVLATNLSISEICASVGFESLGSFSTLYKKHFGASPVQHRAESR